MRYLGQRIFCTGDINLATALLSIGFAPWQENRCEIIASDNGKTYGQFRFHTVSDCGRYTADECNLIFAGDANPTHAFTHLCDFIRNKPKGIASAADWLTYAFDAAKDRTAHLPRFDEASAADYVARHPDNIESYGFAFAINRRKAYEMINEAQRSYLHNHGNAAAKISNNLPKRVANELLGRIA
jgi:hypothetical protein